MKSETPTKSLKINSVLHKELRVFAAMKEENVMSVVEEAIVRELKRRKHKFQNTQ